MPKTTQGQLQRVPCPHCNVPNNFQELAGDESGGWGEAGLEKGATVSCDSCNRLMKIFDIVKVTVIKVVAV